MVTTYTHHKLTWVDLENPTRAEIDDLLKKYDIHPLVGEELLIPTVRPKVDLYDNCIYLILHFPTVHHAHNGKREEEVDFIIGKDFLVTVHYDVVDPLREFSKAFEVNSLLDRSTMGAHGGYLFFYMVKELYKNLGSDLNAVLPRLHDIEENIFKGEEKKMVRELSLVNKILLDFRESIRFHKEVLESFEAASKHFFEPKFEYYTRALVGEYYKVFNHLESQRETVSDLRETNDSLLSTKINEVMKIIAVISFITFPLSLVAAIFGMNTVYLPIVGMEGDFWIVTGTMATMMLFILGFFKYKKWL